MLTPATQRYHNQPRNPGLWLFVTFLLALLPALSQAQTDNAQAALHSLDYIAVDYPGTVTNGVIINETEYAEQAEFCQHLITTIAALPDKPGRDAILEQARQLQQQIQARADGNLVAQSARAAGQQLAQLYQVRLTPRAAPDLQQAAEMFHGKCVSCHGSQGFGDGPTAAKLDPPPINFHDRDRAMERSVYGLYSAITLGVEGTKMRSFHDLSEGQRWGLAFYVSNFLFSDADRAAGETAWQQGGDTRLDLDKLSQMTPAAVVAMAGDQGLAQLAYLRAHPEVVMDKVHPLDTTNERLGSSLASYQSGDVERAYRDAVAAYIEGFELAEASLRATNPAAVAQLEKEMLSYRQLIKSRAPAAEVESQYHSLISALDQARQGGNQHISGQAGAISAAVILLREGLEAILILAAIAGVLIKTGRRDALRYLHAGWVSALLLGGLTWVVSTYLFAIGGANRELTEGITALVAAAVLVYVGFWLHSKTSAKRWREFVEVKIKGALQGRALWALTFVAFLAVYREVFETVLFYQALWMQTDPQQHSSLWGGIFAGLATLLLLGWLILRYSMRLPLRLLFNINSIIMFVLAVAFTGHGIAALQKIGMLPIDTAPLPHIALLGIYPTIETTVTQLLIAGLIITIMMRERSQAAAQTS